MPNAKTQKRKPLKEYTVHIQFQAFGFNLMATSEADAKKKAINRLSRRNLSALVDKGNSSASKW